MLALCLVPLHACPVVAVGLAFAMLPTTSQYVGVSFARATYLLKHK